MRSHSLAHTDPFHAAREIHPEGPAASPDAVRFVGRPDETAGILAALRQPGLAGVVVVGTPGAGKTALLQHVQRSLTDAYLVRVRGLSSATPFPFRSLSFLLSVVPADVTHPALVFNAVLNHLRLQAGGRRVVFVVDNAEHLDRSSSALIGQLVAADAARLVMTVNDFAQVDPMFMSMWRSASLRRVDLPMLTFDETGALVEADLGAPVSRECIEVLWAVGGGNPQATRAALRGLVQRGTVARSGFAWVLLGGRPGIGPELVRSPILDGLTASQRDVITLLALAGPLSWVELAHLTDDPSSLDGLQDSGLLVIDPTSGPRVSIADPCLSTAVSEAVNQPDAATLYLLLDKLPDARRRLELDPARHVAWRLKAGQPVTAEQALTAVTALNDDGHHDRAEDLIETLDATVSSGRLSYQGVLAAIGVGHLTRASAHAASLAEAADPRDPGLWTLHKISESRLRRVRFPGNPAQPLDEASAWLESTGQDAMASGNALADIAGLDRLVLAARAELAAFEGRYRENVELLPEFIDLDLPTSSSRADREFQVIVQSLLLEAQATVDPHCVAVDLAQSLARNLAHPDVPYRIADAALLRVEIAFRAAGGWSEGAALLREISRRSERWSLRRGSLAQLSDGLMLMEQDHPREAIHALTPVVEQLRLADPHGLLPVVAAALTLCFAQCSAPGLVMPHLPAVGGRRGSPWMVRRAARHYQLLSASRTGSRSEAARTFHDCALDDLQRGATVWALVSLAMAVRLGRQQAVGDLAELAGNLESPIARTCRLYARALQEPTAQLFVEAMESAAATGDRRLVADIALSGSDTAARLDDRTAARTIKRRLRELLPELRHDVGGQTRFDRLTAREREMAVLAASGRSNRAIAQQLFLSVRTVEGHLYQVYSKLSVRTRAELAEILPTDRTP